MHTRFYFAVFILSLLSFALPGRAQQTAPYQMRFLKAATVEALGEKQILVLFEVSAASRKDLPVLDKQFKYTIGEGGQEHLARIGDGARLVVYGDNLRDKAPIIYNYVKDKVSTGTNHMTLAFYIPSTPEEDASKMSFSYRLRPKGKGQQSSAFDFAFAVEQ